MWCRSELIINYVALIRYCNTLFGKIADFIDFYQKKKNENATETSSLQFITDFYYLK